MTTHQIGSSVEKGFIDKRRTTLVADSNIHTSRRPRIFEANAGGTTNTIVGANAAPGTANTNVVRRGEQFRLFNSSSVLKQETVFTITGIAVAASTTVTFSPAASANTASGDFLRMVGEDSLASQNNMDARLLVIGYTQTQINQMTENDKVFAIRLSDDLDGLNY